MKVRIFIAIIAAVFSNCNTSRNNKVNIMDGKTNVLPGILYQYPQYFDSILRRKDELNVQIIYTQINRDKNNIPSFKDFYYNVNDNNYFYPASTVKFPVAVLALQKLNELKIEGVDKNTAMITEADGDGQTTVYADSTAEDSKPSVGQYIKKILLVSDNDAFNRLYEFLGQEYINNTLHKMGYTNVQIIHRLDISLTEPQNRHTNPVNFYDNNGKIIYRKPAERSQLVYAPRNTRLGKGYMKGDSIIHEPLDFSKKNRISIADLHSMLRSVLFPQSVPANQRFDLTASDYAFLYKHMSMTPHESRYPFYDTANYRDNYVKFLFYGSEKITTDPNIRIFNKVGDAYGFLRDAAYIADFKTSTEFMLSAVIYCNSDGILNDDKYDYDSLGFPFMKHLGRVIYEYELNRKRTRQPDLSTFKFNYQD